MKKFAFATGGLIVANVIAHVAIDTFKASGGTIGGAAFLAMPYLVPAPLRLMTRAAKTA
jgi:hypothetical protein